MKCHKCKKPSNMVCYKCQIPICSKHVYSTNHRFYCATCFLKERQIGLAKQWGMLAALILIGVILIVVLI